MEARGTCNRKNEERREVSKGKVSSKRDEKRRAGKGEKWRRSIVKALPEGRVSLLAGIIAPAFTDPLPCPALPCPALSYLVLPCPAITNPFLLSTSIQPLVASLSRSGLQHIIDAIIFFIVI